MDGNKKEEVALSRDKNRLTVEIVTGRSIFLAVQKKRGREGKEEAARLHVFRRFERTWPVAFLSLTCVQRDVATFYHDSL